MKNSVVKKMTGKRAQNEIGNHYSNSRGLAHLRTDTIASYKYALLNNVGPSTASCTYRRSSAAAASASSCRAATSRTESR